MVIGFDASWSGTGWCIATREGPRQAGHVRPGSKAWRMAALTQWLHGDLEHLAVEHQAELGASSPPVRVVVERLPWNYQRKGSQVRTVYGISGIAHVIAAWGCRPGWRYPYLIPPNGDRKARDPKWEPGWRQWWGIRGKGRFAKKQAAITTVRMLGWGALLEGHKPINADGDGPQGDVAEGILIAVGAARHPNQGPAGPAGPAAWRR